MDVPDYEALHEQIMTVVQGMPVWLKILRYLNVAAFLALAVWIWRSSVLGSVWWNVLIFAGGLAFTAWVNIEIWIFAGRLDIIGLLPFLPLVYVGGKTIQDRMTG
ncbi:hypothetical protein KQI52_04870 [bacterium]|nr:hypothetical protein [bacterium]